MTAAFFCKEVGLFIVVSSTTVVPTTVCLLVAVAIPGVLFQTSSPNSGAYCKQCAGKSTAHGFSQEAKQRYLAKAKIEMQH